MTNEFNPMTRAERSMLFVPAARWSMIEKAAVSDADAVCIDLEDSVPFGEKEAARANVIRAFTELDFGARTKIYRMNGLDTPFAAGDVAQIIEAVGDRIDLVMLPKAGSAADVIRVANWLSAIEQKRGFKRLVGIEAQIETAAGFVWAREIAQSSTRLEALVFGAGDYAASMRMPATGIGTMDENDAMYPGHRWHAVMHTIVACARAFGLRAIDGPYSAHTDAPGMERACRIARAMGFDGKQCIHPSQLKIANTVFSPTADEIAHARAVMAAYEAAVADGKGAVTMDGKMIDEANVRMARVVLERLAANG